MKRNYYLTLITVITLFSLYGCGEITPPVYDNRHDYKSENYEITPPYIRDVMGISQTSIELHWGCFDEHIIRVNIERSINNGPFEVIKEIPVTKTPGDVSSFTDTGLNEANQYKYRICAFSEKTKSGYSGICIMKMSTAVDRSVLTYDESIAAACSHDGSYMVTSHFNASAKDNAQIRFWDPVSQSFIKSFSERPSSVNTLAFSPDDELLASGSDDGIISLWNVKSGSTLRTIGPLGAKVRSLAFSTDGQVLAVATDDKKISIYSTKDYEKLNSLSLHTATVNTLAFSKDGTTMASGSADGNIILWNTGTWTATRTINAGSEVKSVAYSPDGQLVSAAAGKNFYQWQASGGSLVKSLAATDSFASSVAFSSGRGIFAAMSENDLTFYDDNFNPFDKYYGKATYRMIVPFSGEGMFVSTGVPSIFWAVGKQWRRVYR
ncbi:MAG: hypothetical protein ACM3S2_09145 [Ignavibacteriales bacterium]